MSADEVTKEEEESGLLSTDTMGAIVLYSQKLKMDLTSVPAAMNVKKALMMLDDETRGICMGLYFGYAFPAHVKKRVDEFTEIVKTLRATLKEKE